jgi:hypothetical protein
MFRDNRRQIIEPEGFKGLDLSEKLLDSKPLLNKNQASKLRFLSKFPYTPAYNKNNSFRVGSAYKSNIEVEVRNFIKVPSKTTLFGFERRRI